MTRDRDSTGAVVVVVAFLALAAVLGTVAGVWSWLTTRTQGQQENEAAAQQQGFLKSIWDGITGAASMMFL